jgi:threonine dehydrogenase-like Zn-dependent dehydrogenase
LKAARLRAPRQWEFVEVDQPEPRMGQMRIRLQQVALCGSDMPDYHGVAPEYPLLPGGSGHEGIGIVEACPSGTYEVGETVLLWGFDRDNGLFQESVLTHDAGLLRMPAEEPVEKVLMSQLLGTVIRPFRKISQIINQHVVVIGQGPTGQLFDSTLRNLGARSIVAVDPLDYRLEVGRRSGATHTLNPDRDDIVEAVREITGGDMADIVVEAVGDADTYRLAADLTRRNGTVIGFGVPDKGGHEGEVQLPLLHMQRREIRLIMTVNAGDNPYDDYATALDWICQGRIDVSHLITHILPFDQIQAAFDLFADRPVGERAVKVVLQY